MRSSVSFKVPWDVMQNLQRSMELNYISVTRLHAEYYSEKEKKEKENDGGI